MMKFETNWRHFSIFIDILAKNGAVFDNYFIINYNKILKYSWKLKKYFYIYTLINQIFWIVKNNSFPFDGICIIVFFSAFMRLYPSIYI